MLYGWEGDFFKEDSEVQSVYCEFSMQSVALLYMSTKTVSVSYNTMLCADHSTIYIS